jgi:hypothetical protein
MEENGMSDGIANISSLWVEPYLEKFIPPKPKHPTVMKHNQKHLTTEIDVWNWMAGFKDGLANLAPVDSHLRLCNQNVSLMSDTYYWNYYYMFANTKTIETNFGP